MIKYRSYIFLFTYKTNLFKLKYVNALCDQCDKEFHSDFTKCMESGAKVYLQNLKLVKKALLIKKCRDLKQLLTMK